MTAKNQTDWPVEKLKKWAKPALEYPKLVEIACTAASNTEAKDKALEFTKEQGLEEKVAMACRWLRILRAKLSEEEFKNYLAKKNLKQETKKVEKKKKQLSDIEFELPHGIEVMTRESYDPPSPYLSQKRSLRFLSSKKFETLLLEMLEAYNGADFPRLFDGEMKDKMIQILEENFGMEPFIKALEEKGLRAKICGNCEHCLPQYDPNHMGFCLHKRDSQKLFEGACYIDNGFESCKHWAPKGVEEKKGKMKVIRLAEKTVHIKKNAKPPLKGKDYCFCGKKLKEGHDHYGVYYECPDGHRYRWKKGFSAPQLSGPQV